MTREEYFELRKQNKEMIAAEMQRHQDEIARLHKVLEDAGKEVVESTSEFHYGDYVKYSATGDPNKTKTLWRVSQVKGHVNDSSIWFSYRITPVNGKRIADVSCCVASQMVLQEAPAL